MTNPVELPLTLWNANLELQRRIGQLLQESAQAWLDQGAHALDEGMVETGTELRDALRGGDWQAIAALPAEAFWRQVELRLGDGQALVQVAMNAQNAFASGLIEALQAWQAQTARAWTGPGTPGVEDLWRLASAPWGMAEVLAPQPETARPSAAKAKAPAKRAAASAPAPRKRPTGGARKPAAAAKGKGKGPRRRGG
jgi:hypothetical protein